MKRAVLLFTIIALGAITAVAYANQTQNLQPTFRLMNGEEELGVVYGLDYGWLILTAEDTIYTCGCGAPVPCELPTQVPDEPLPTPRPTEEPVPSPEPTEKPKCNRGLGNGSELCDPGNSSGKPGNAGEGNE